MRLRRDELDARFPGLLDSVLKRDGLALGGRGVFALALARPRAPAPPRRQAPRPPRSRPQLRALPSRPRRRAPRPSTRPPAPQSPSPQSPSPRPPSPRPPPPPARPARRRLGLRALLRHARLEDERRVDELEVHHLGAVARAAARDARCASSRPAARRSVGRARSNSLWTMSFEPRKATAWRRACMSPRRPRVIICSAIGLTAFALVTVVLMRSCSISSAVRFA